jgi:intracellular septation protein A
MNRKLKEKIWESLSSVAPVPIIIFILSIRPVPIPIGTTIMFLAGAGLLVVGMGFFSLGADIAMMPIGEAVGSQLSRTGKAWLVVLVSLPMGFIITAAEPDLQVLARQVPAIPDLVLIGTVALGVGLFLVVAMLRIIFKVGLSRILIVFYLILFAVSAFAPRDFVAVAFDSGGVTTGPMTVPFIIALGIGLSAARGGLGSQENSFGLVSICSIGPVLAVLILGIGYNPTDATYTPVELVNVITTEDVADQYARELPRYLDEVLMALVPICVFFAVFQGVTGKFQRKQLLTVGIGLLYTLIGLVLFLTGVNVGFIPVGHLIGSDIAASEYKWALIPLGMIIGYFIVVAEPAVHILNKQVEEISGGTVSQRAMKLSLSIGIAVSLALSMLRILTGISIFWLLIPGYAAALALTFFSPPIFTGIAFDSGGVASGPMTSTFLLPFAMGACESIGGNVLTDAFGIVAMVAMTPLITIQLLGMIYAHQTKTAEKIEAAEFVGADDVIDYEEGSSK